nr:translation initiation factor IF-2-like [Equus asinus]
MALRANETTSYHRPLRPYTGSAAALLVRPQAWPSSDTLFRPHGDQRPGRAGPAARPLAPDPSLGAAARPAPRGLAFPSSASRPHHPAAPGTARPLVAESPAATKPAPGLLPLTRRPLPPTELKPANGSQARAQASPRQKHRNVAPLPGKRRALPRHASGTRLPPSRTQHACVRRSPRPSEPSRHCPPLSRPDVCLVLPDVVVSPRDT